MVWHSINIKKNTFTMKKFNFPNVTLNCVMQQANMIQESQCFAGIISRKGYGQFRFEEMTRKGRGPLNPKLYDGEHVSMVRMKNGMYQFHMKTLSDKFDRKRFAFAVYKEISEALKILD